MRYYFVASSLPPLSLGTIPEISFEQLSDDFAMNLTLADRKKVANLLEPIDIFNIKAFYLGAPLDDKGSILGKDLEEALLEGESLPKYVLDFLEEHESSEDRLRYFPSLVSQMYAQKREGFLGEYFAFEREMMCVITALRAKKMGRDLVKEFQFEDPTDPLIAEIIAQKDAPDYTPPNEYEDLKAVFVENSSDPKALARGFAKYRFNRLGEFEAREDFTMDRILAHTARLLLVENAIDPEEDKLRTATDIIEELSEYG